MKVVKKLATILLSVCLVLPCFAMLTHAAEGQIVFSDPSTKVGETVEVTGVVRAQTPIGDADLELTYDTDYLKFKSGDNVTEASKGSLKYSTKGTKSEKERRFNMQFEVLKEGTAKIKLKSYTVWRYEIDERINCSEGFSTIKIAAGQLNNQPSEEEPVAEAVSVQVEGKSYQLTDSFAPTEIPLGFEEGTLMFQGVEHKAAVLEKAGVSLGYLVDEKKVGTFFLYDEKKETFSPFEQVHVSDTVAIMLLAEHEGVKLPKEFQETEISLNNHTFPAWCNAERSDFYILYALNSHGDKELYQYDSVDGTYQRYDAPEVKKEQAEDTVVNKATSLVEEYLNYIVLAGVIALVILVVLLIVVSVKLHNRNAELDELYDEYGIDLDDEPMQILDMDEKEEKSILYDMKETDHEEENRFIDEFDRALEEQEAAELDEEDDDLVDDFDDFFDDEDDEEAEKAVRLENTPTQQFVIPEEEPVQKREEKEDYDLDFIDLDD